MDSQHHHNYLPNRQHFLAGAAVSQASQASQVASHAANAAEYYQREAIQAREIAQAEIHNAQQTIHSIVAQAKAFVAQREGSMEQAQAVQATEDQAMRAISAIQVKATRVNENLRSKGP